MSSTPEPMDETVVLDLALAALREVTPEATVGALAAADSSQDGVLSLRFENLLAGYPGWFWTVSLAQVPDAAPTVLEVELLPGDDALLAPEWVPWAVRLADYQSAQAALRAAGEDADEDAGETDHDLDDELADVEDIDIDDFEVDGSAILHSGDVDGVDLELAAGADDEFDEGSDDEDPSDDDDDDVDDESDDDESDDDESDDDESDDDESDDDESDEGDDDSADEVENDEGPVAADEDDDRDEA
ncbi:DUF3027 domain-containing protein [Microbacterium sp. BWT-B31]|uniref:DUF3027 domain-containing protein n=1 Tax=Microbacterium sp. BWT-B31 TaxID=3232072 RepID=UPI003528E640